jgi:hypothetical protein
MSKPNVWEADDIAGLEQAIEGFRADQYVDLQAEVAAAQAARRLAFLAGVGEGAQLEESTAPQQAG